VHVTGPAPRDRRTSEEEAAEEAAEKTADEAVRKRRLAEIFGDVLPETTSDERDSDDSAAGAGESASDEWLRRQVPPHHGS